jgi:hypothetical protein
MAIESFFGRINRIAHFRFNRRLRLCLLVLQAYISSLCSCPVIDRVSNIVGVNSSEVEGFRSIVIPRNREIESMPTILYFSSVQPTSARCGSRPLAHVLGNAETNTSINEAMSRREACIPSRRHASLRYP